VKLVWDDNSWEDYVWWQTEDRKILKRITALIKDIERNGNDGIGKPEPLEHGFRAIGHAGSRMSTGSSTK